MSITKIRIIQSPTNSIKQLNIHLKYKKKSLKLFFNYFNLYFSQPGHLIQIQNKEPRQIKLIIIFK